MRYLINNLIVYDSKMKTLVNVNFTEDVLELTPGSVATLLDYFISHPHVVLEKKEIIEKAFADSPYSGSESNINKSLSILRRSFRDVGEDGSIISTMPSLGFVFNANVEGYEEVARLGTVKNIKDKINNKKHQLCAIFLVITTLAVMLFFIMNSSEMDSCKIILRGFNIPKNKEVEVAPETKRCIAPGVIINAPQNKSEKNKTHSLMAICDSSSESCLNLIRK